MASMVVGVALGLLVLGVILRTNRQTPQLSLADKCSTLGGEWLYKSADLICLMADGTRLVYSSANDGFEPQVHDSGIIPVAQASTQTDEMVELCKIDDAPVLADYATDVVKVHKPQVDFSTNTAARLYRTAISKDVSRGVNFAGKYVVSTWGCGEACVGSAVVNADTGKILMYGLQASSYDFAVDSRLLQVGETGYYSLEDDELQQLCE